MDDPTPFILIELVLTFGGVLLFAWWQLRELNQRAAAREAARREAEARGEVAGAESPASRRQARPPRETGAAPIRASS